jgi:hypothetical protein
MKCLYGIMASVVLSNVVDCLISGWIKQKTATWLVVASLRSKSKDWSVSEVTEWTVVSVV